MIYDSVVCLFCTLHVHRVGSLEVRIQHRCGVMVVSDESTVEHSVAVAVEIVTVTVEMVGFSPVVEILLRTFRSCNEVIIHDVLVVVGSRVAANDSHSVIIYYIIIVLQVTLHLRVAALVVSPKTVVNGPVACAVCDGTESLWFYTF